MPFNVSIGGLAALLSAAFWALSAILFKLVSDKASPWGLALVKSLAGALLLGGIVSLPGLTAVPREAMLFLGLSGLLGIALGDTLFFASLDKLGPRDVLLLGTLGPAFTVLLAVVFLGERPSPYNWAGMALTLGGIYWAMSGEAGSDPGRGGAIAAGVKYGVLSALCNSAGIILAKAGVSSVSAMEATFIRFLWGAAGLLAAAQYTRSLKSCFVPFGEGRTAAILAAAVLTAVFGGYWLFMFALKYTDASLAAVLNETAPLFALPLSMLILKKSVSARAAAGALAAVGGVVLIFA
ncbi:MAG: hypothetical protein A2X32_11865 [Elusimicrobia bacterium GWC2_64_44]|nr:MAG: hypothetical protein A2X32_11865 [Elusimicrobia bacterium GWC2_64_44]